MKNRFEIYGDETVIYVKHNTGLTGARVDTVDLPTVQKFSGTWALAGTGRRSYVQGKWYNPETDQPETVYLHRWIVGADGDTLVQLGRDTLDCRRQNLHVSLKRRSYARQIERRDTPTERLQYTKALASRLAQMSALTSTQALRGLQRGTFDASAEETASRIAGERISSLPPLRVRAGWEHRLPDILEVLQTSSAPWIGRRQVEELFRVSRNTAVKILDRFGASFVGPALQLRREDLMERLQQLVADPAISFERERHTSTLKTAMRDELGEALRLAAKRVASAERSYLEGAEVISHLNTRFADLPADVQLTPSNLQINFRDFKDFLGKIGSVVYALHNDAKTVEEFIDQV